MRLKIPGFAFLFLIGFMLLTFPLKGQSYRAEQTGFFKNWRLNINGGSNVFYGDLKDEGVFPYDVDYRLAYGVKLRKQFSPAFGMGLQILNGKLHSTTKNPPGDQYDILEFDASVFEYNFYLLLDFMGMFAGYNPNRAMNAFMFVGLGFSNWQTELMDYNTGKLIRSNGFSGKGPGKRTTEFVLPFGLGLKYNISNKWSISLETAMHAVNSDILDATEGGFAYDAYNYTSLGITYNFNRNMLKQEKEPRENIRIKQRHSRKKEKEIQKEASKKQSNTYYYEDLERTTTKPQPEPEIKVKESQDISEFKKKYPENELPIVAEYKMQGVFSKDKKSGGKNEEIAPRSGRVTEKAPIQKPQQSKGGRILKPKDDLPLLEIVEEEASQPKEDLFYGVQILATKEDTDIEAFASKLNIHREIKIEKNQGIFRFVVVAFSSYEKAEQFRSSLNTRGLNDAFIVAYKNGQRIQMSEAR